MVLRYLDLEELHHVLHVPMDQGLTRNQQLQFRIPSIPDYAFLLCFPLQGYANGYEAQRRSVSGARLPPSVGTHHLVAFDPLKRLSTNLLKNENSPSAINPKHGKITRIIFTASVILPLAAKNNAPTRIPAEDTAT